MIRWHSDSIHVNGLKLHYRRSGGIKPPLILTHGFSDDGACWIPVAARLVDDYDVIMPDARGHGLSEGPEQGYTPAEQGDDLIKLIQALDIRKPIILGHSMGALTAIVVGGTEPDLVRALLLEDPPPWWLKQGLPPAFTAEQVAKMREEFVARKQRPREDLMAEQRAATPTWSADEIEFWADSKLRLNPTILELFEPGMSTTLDWSAVLTRITCPTLLITADTALGAIVTPDAVTAIRELVKQIEVAHIPGAGHSIHREQFDLYMRAVRSFLGTI